MGGEALGALMGSIEKHGLLHPIVVREGVNGSFSLVAGARRLAAVSNMGGLGQGYLCGGLSFSPGLVACLSLGSLSQLEAEEAELEENIRRVDLTLQERIAATGRLAGLRSKKAEAVGGPQPTVADLSTEIRGSSDGSAGEATRRELILSQHLDNLEVAKAKTLDEAWKAHLRQEQAQRHAELGKQVGATFGAHSHSLHLADSLEWLQAAASEQFDVILTDPPYGIGADSFGDAGGRLQAQTHEYADTADTWRALCSTYSALWFRVAKPQAHLYLCCDIDGFHFAREQLAAAGWWVTRTPLINYKLDGSRVPHPEHGPQRKWEMILYAIKGRKPVTRIYSDVIETRGDPNLAHGAQKPVALFKNLLTRSVRPGDTVLDCFLGTGTAVVAGHELLCRVTGVEKDPTYYGVAVQRVQALK